MMFLNDINCQNCDRFVTKEQWCKHLFCSRHLHREVNDYWPAIFPQRKLTRDEGMKLEKVFWEMIFVTDYCTEVYDFLKIFFRMCTRVKKYFQYARGLMIQMKKNNGDVVIEII